MSSPKGRSSKIELSVLASHPELLTGLEAGLRLGLLSPAQVEQLCRQYLVCPLRDPAVGLSEIDGPRTPRNEPKVPAPSTPQATPSSSENPATTKKTHTTQPLN